MFHDQTHLRLTFWPLFAAILVTGPSGPLARAQDISLPLIGLTSRCLDKLQDDYLSGVKDQLDTAPGGEFDVCKFAREKDELGLVKCAVFATPMLEGGNCPYQREWCERPKDQTASQVKRKKKEVSAKKKGTGEKEGAVVEKKDNGAKKEVNQTTRPRLQDYELRQLREDCARYEGLDRERALTDNKELGRMDVTYSPNYLAFEDWRTANKNSKIRISRGDNGELKVDDDSVALAVGTLNSEISTLNNDLIFTWLNNLVKETHRRKSQVYRAVSKYPEKCHDLSGFNSIYSRRDKAVNKIGSALNNAVDCLTPISKQLQENAVKAVKPLLEPEAESKRDNVSSQK
jgi:hypothetical protein